MEKNKEVALLSRLAANHLFLAQFEPLRAALLALHRRDSSLAVSVLHAAVFHASGDLAASVPWSPSSCPSPAFLSWLSSLLLLDLHDALNSRDQIPLNPTVVPCLDPDSLHLCAEFVLYTHQIRSKILNRGDSNVDESDVEEKGFGVLDRIAEIGFKRLRDNVASASGGEDGPGMRESEGESEESLGSREFVERELVWLRKAVLGFGVDDVFEALCQNIRRQLQLFESFDPRLAIEGGNHSNPRWEDGFEAFRLILKSVQIAHLDCMKNFIHVGDTDGVIAHIRFLHLDYGLPEAEYRMVLQDLIKSIVTERELYGDAWQAMQEKLLRVYGEALASNCPLLVQMIQAIQDELLYEEIEMHGTLGNNKLPLPFERLQRYFKVMSDAHSGDTVLSSEMALHSCMRDMYHYARVSGVHVLECVMDAALLAVKREQLPEASNILMLFPRLRPLVAVMGWDLLSSKTTARRKLMQHLWTRKSQVFCLEDSSLYGNQSDEVSCIEHLCDSLCYQLDVASFVACVNAGQTWSSKSSLLLSGKELVAIRDEEIPDEEDRLDPFVENFVLERLSLHSPLRVLFDVVPGIKFLDAIELISMQPIVSTAAAWKRMQDVELMHMRYALEFTVLALGAMERSATDETESHHQMALCYLKDLHKHLEAMSNLPRKVFLVNIIISLLHMDDLCSNFTHCASSESSSEVAPISDTVAINKGGNKMVISFTGVLLDILRCNLPSSLSEEEHVMGYGITVSGKQALEWRISNAQQFIEDWVWRLSILQRLLPLSERQWRWKEALTVLRAAPSKLLNLCMQRAKFDIGEEAVHRFSLPPEDKATLILAEWVEGAFRRTSVEDAVSRAANGTSAIQELDFASLRAQLGPLAAILLCIDVAATSARSVKMSQQLLDQAQAMLSEIYPGRSPKVGSTYWDQIHEVGLISVTKRLLKRLLELLEEDKSPALQDIISGETMFSTSKEIQRQSQRERALALLHQMIDDAHKGKRQFLSGKLHNLARAIADEENDAHHVKRDGPYTDKQLILNSDNDVILGLGLKAFKQSTFNPSAGESFLPPSSYDKKDPGKKLFGPLTSKLTTYLSQFILHIAAIGDIVDGTDTTHDFNFFSLVYEWPKDLLTRLVFDRGSTDAAGKVAEIMFADFVHEVISACVPPVYPPRSGRGWACIPVVPSCSRSSSENKAFSPSFKEAKPNRYSYSSATPGTPLYPLQLDIVRHLVKLSPVRAVLACVFGSSILHGGNDSSLSSSLNNGLLQSPDADRLFYEFALDQSERFPTLNRWIQMQTNLHRVSEFVVSPKHLTDAPNVKPTSRAAFKRVREYDSDTESEVDDTVVGGSIPIALTDLSGQGGAGPDPWLVSSKSEIAEQDSTVFFCFDWENEEPYVKTVDRLIDEGKLMDALALSDRFLCNGASDRLLQLLIEHGEENYSITGVSQGYEGQGMWSDNWQYCLRLRDKQLAAELALKYLHRWELDSALDILIMCSCHLLQNDPLRNEVLQRRQALQSYKLILCADNHYSSWQEVEADCKEDPEGLALRLAGKGAVSAALEVAESAGLSIDLRRELQGRQLVKLLTADPLNGGGPAEASRFLSSLRDSDDALPVAMGAMQLLPNLRSKQLLVHFFLKRREGNLSDLEVSRLNSWALGLRVLASLPLPWQQRCSSLHEHPHLILEVLLMRKQLQSASLILKEFPSLRDNNLIIVYAAKAIAVSLCPPSREPRISISGSRPKQKTRAGAPVRSSFTNSLSNLHREARRAFSWAPRNKGEKSAPKNAYRKRKNSGLAPTERAAWEAMTGIHEDHVSSYAVDAQERIPPISISEEWMLTGDPQKDEAVRSSHRYESAPDINLFKVLLSLCSDESVSAKGGLDLCINQMKKVLSYQQLPDTASMETIGQAYHATETIVQGLIYSKSLLRKFSGGSDLSSNSERSRDADDASSDACSSCVGSQATDELSEILLQADIWLGRAELLQSLMGSGIAASLDDIADKESSARLRDRLIVDEQYSMAVYTCKKCKIDAFPVWNAWGNALIRMEHYAQARVKFKQALQLHKGDPGPVVLEIINTIEGGPPVDVSTVRSMYDHLARSAPTILDDSLSADSYLNVLYMPSTFPRSESSRHSQECANSNSINSLEFGDGPCSNLDSIRYAECVNYLQEYCRQHLLSFMFRHGHYNDGCMLFFPLKDVPPPPMPSSLGVVASASSPQKSDRLATDYGTIDDLCDLCIGYGAMTVLEEVISMRVSSVTQQDVEINQHTASALSRICNYCEIHKHFNYLYKFQVIKKDYIAAGLCCIQLFINSSSQEEAVNHLELAKIHFEEGLLARYKTGDSTKLVTKGIRGKNASEKLSEEGLVKYSARVSIQVDVVRAFNDQDGPQWRYSLFGNPNDIETFRRRCKIAETLAEKNFDLAFQVIYEFYLPAVDIYAGVAASLAERKRGGQLTEFFRNIKGTIDDVDWDQVLGAAINVYANRHKERPDRLIDMLTSSHRKVLACVVCGRLKSAFQIASRSGSVADVQYVAHQALHANALPVLDMCKQWLAQYM